MNSGKLLLLLLLGVGVLFAQEAAYWTVVVEGSQFPWMLMGPTFREGDSLMQTKLATAVGVSETWAIGKLKNEHARTEYYIPEEPESIRGEPVVIESYYGKASSTYTDDIIEAYIAQLDDEEILEKGITYQCDTRCGPYPYYYVLIVGYDPYGRVVDWYDYAIDNREMIPPPGFATEKSFGVMTKTFRDLLWIVQNRGNQIPMAKGLGYIFLIEKNSRYTLLGWAREKYSTTAGTTIPWRAYGLFSDRTGFRYQSPSFSSLLVVILMSHAMQSPVGGALKGSSFICGTEPSSFTTSKFLGKGGLSTIKVFYDSWITSCGWRDDLPAWVYLHDVVLMNEMSPDVG